jgi:hypothetical protein
MCIMHTYLSTYLGMSLDLASSIAMHIELLPTQRIPNRLLNKLHVRQQHFDLVYLRSAF